MFAKLFATHFEKSVTFVVYADVYGHRPTQELSLVGHILTHAT